MKHKMVPAQGAYWQLRHEKQRKKFWEISEDSLVYITSNANFNLLEFCLWPHNFYQSEF